MASATALRASIASGSADAECLAAHFVVCGLAPGLLEPNSFGDSSRVDASHEVITDIAIVSASRGELIPPGYEPVLTAGGGARSAPAIGSIATIGGTQSTQLQIAVRRQALNACGCGSSETPITALQVIYADRNEKPDAGYEALRRPDGGESACFSGGSRGREAVICASRSLSSESAVPLVDIAVVHCDRHARDVRLPAGYELLPRSLTAGSAGAAVFVAFRRALPVGLLNTPLRPAMLDHISASDRPRVEARRCRPGSTAANCAEMPRGGEGFGAGGAGAMSGGDVGEQYGGRGQGDVLSGELPHALPHFCFPRGVLLRNSGAWPTVHEFALTDASGRRLYGACLTVWEPLVGDVLLRPEPRDRAGEGGRGDPGGQEGAGNTRHSAGASSCAKGDESSRLASVHVGAPDVPTLVLPLRSSPLPCSAQLPPPATPVESSAASSPQGEPGAHAVCPAMVRLPRCSYEGCQASPIHAGGEGAVGGGIRSSSESADGGAGSGGDGNGGFGSECGDSGRCYGRGTRESSANEVMEATQAQVTGLLMHAFAAGHSLWWEPPADADWTAGRQQRHACTPDRAAVFAVRGQSDSGCPSVGEGRTLHAPTCLCVLSRTPCFGGLRKWLCMVYRHSLTAADVPVEALITSLLWEAPLPPPGHIVVRIGIGGEHMAFERPAPARELPETSLPLGALLDALQPPQLLTLFTATLLEHKVLLVSSRLSQLTAAAETFLALLWPLCWQGVYIPLLPGLLVEVLQSPVPFICGVHTSTHDAAARALPSLLPQDAFIANLDDGTLIVPQASAALPTLPHAHLLLAALEAFRSQPAPLHHSGSADEVGNPPALPPELNSPDAAFPIRLLNPYSEEGKIADAVSTAQRAVVRHTFASFFALLLRGYQECLVMRPARATLSDFSQLVDFPSLLASRSPVEACLLGHMQHTQAFARFIEQRTSFSSRAPEYVLFDHLADQCAAAPPGDTISLPALPAAPARSRVYQVPPPQPALDGATFGPNERWPRLRPDRIPQPRSIPPFNFAAAPIELASLATGAAGRGSDLSSSPLSRSPSPARAQARAQGPLDPRRADHGSLQATPGRPPAVGADSGLQRMWDNTGTASARSSTGPAHRPLPRPLQLSSGASGPHSKPAPLQRRSSSMPMALLRTLLPGNIPIPPERRQAAAEAVAIMAAANGDGVAAPPSPAARPAAARPWMPVASPTDGSQYERGASLEPVTPSRLLRVATLAAAAAEEARERQLRRLPGPGRKWYQRGKAPRTPYVSPFPMAARPLPSQLEWARRTAGELHAAFCIVFSLAIERQPSPADAVGAAVGCLRRLHGLGVTPPQSAQHALLQACIRAQLGSCARGVFAQLQETGCRPDALTLGWYQHALLMEGAMSPRRTSSATSGTVGSQAPSSANGTSHRSSRFESPRNWNASAPSTPRTRPITRSPLTSEEGLSPRALQERLATAVGLGKRARLRVAAAGDGCGCGGTLGAREAVEGWHLAGDEARLDYASRCPRCAGLWQPLLLVRLGDDFSAPNGAAASLGGLDESGEAGSAVPTSSRTRRRVDETHESADAIDGELSCPFLSPTLLLQELAMVTQNASGQDGQRALADGWARCRHLFPSLFWNLCWHFAPEGLLPGVPHFRLRHVPVDTASAEASPPHDAASPPATRQYELQLMHCAEDDCAGPVVAEGGAPASLWPFMQTDTLHTSGGGKVGEAFGGWVDSNGHFRTRLGAPPKLSRSSVPDLE